MSKLAKPEVSIIMATYNRAHLIAESLISIQNQTFKNWECIIIDDGSNDETNEVLKPYLKDCRFTYARRSIDHNKGLPGCRNNGLELAKGNFIVFFDDDDIAHPDHLKITVPILRNGKYHFCHYIRKIFFRNFDKHFDRDLSYNLKIIDKNNLEAIITHELSFNSCSVIWKKECFDNNYFNEELMYAEEWELYTRIILNGFHGVSIDKILYFGRKHDASNTGEFYLGDEVRRNSKLKAIRLLALNLKNKKALTPFLTRYFIQLAFMLRDKDLIDFLAYINGFSKLNVWRYQLIRKYYPAISKYLRFKKKFL
tara:strand:- start:738 stop:1670 length:933 start_codon:yes stop_codon:yes gene_type:complete